MPSDLVKRIDLDLVHPLMVERTLNLLAEARGLGFEYFATSGFRSVEVQRELYRKFLKGGPRAAPPGLSGHNFGLAIDLARRLGVKQVSWKPADYEPLRALCKKHGLVSGLEFDDPPHINFPGYVNARQLLPLRDLWIKARNKTPAASDLELLKEVWTAVK